MRRFLNVVAVIGLVAGCGKKERAAENQVGSGSAVVVPAGSGSGPDSGSANAPVAVLTGLDRFTAMSKANHDPSILDQLQLSDDERTRLRELARADGSILFANQAMELTPADAGALASGYRGKAILLLALASLDAPTATALAKWPGETLVLGSVTTLDAATAAALATWPGNNLHLDNVAKLDDAALAALAKWPGKVLGLASLMAQPGFAAKVAGFKAAVPTPVAVDRKPPPELDAAGRATLAKLTTAIADGHPDAVADYLKTGGSPDLNDHGTTLLMLAARARNVAAAKLLVQAHADLNATNADGLTPLYFTLAAPDKAPADAAADTQHVGELAQLLLDAGALVAAPAAPGAHYALPLAQAVQRGDLGLVGLLIAHGAEPTPSLLPAIDAGQADIVVALIANGALVNPKTPTSAASPIHHAIAAAGVALAKPDHDAKTAATWTTIVTALLDAKADLAVKDEHGATPLLELADSAAADEPTLVALAQAMLKHGADKTAKLADGRTADQLATARKHAALAAALK